MAEKTSPEISILNVVRKNPDSPRFASYTAFMEFVATLRPELRPTGIISEEKFNEARGIKAEVRSSEEDALKEFREWWKSRSNHFGPERESLSLADNFILHISNGANLNFSATVKRLARIYDYATTHAPELGLLKNDGDPVAAFAALHRAATLHCAQAGNAGKKAAPKKEARERLPADRDALDDDIRYFINWSRTGSFEPRPTATPLTVQQSFVLHNSENHDITHPDVRARDTENYNRACDNPRMKAFVAKKNQGDLPKFDSPEAYKQFYDDTLVHCCTISFATRSQKYRQDDSTRAVLVFGEFISVKCLEGNYDNYCRFVANIQPHFPAVQPVPRKEYDALIRQTRSAAAGQAAGSR